jgi:hypothetical protein
MHTCLQSGHRRQQSCPIQARVLLLLALLLLRLEVLLDVRNDGIRHQVAQNLPHANTCVSTASAAPAAGRAGAA